MHTFRMKLQLNLYKAVMALTLFFYRSRDNRDSTKPGVCRYFVTGNAVAASNSYCIVAWQFSAHPFQMFGQNGEKGTLDIHRNIICDIISWFRSYS